MRMRTCEFLVCSLLCCAAVALGDDGADLERRLLAKGTGIAATLEVDDVVGLIEVIDNADPKLIKPARDTLAQLCYRLGGTDRREALSTALCEQLAMSDEFKTDTRAYLCEMLGLVGGGEAVNPLYKVMNEIDPLLQEAARQAIVRIPDWTSTLALVGGMQTSKDDLLIGVINGLGKRGDPRGAGMLAGQLLSPNELDVRAALAALSQIAHPDVGQLILISDEEGKPGAKQALLDWADTMIDNEVVSDATKVLLPLVDDESLTPAQRCQWLRALGRVGGELPTNFILRAIDDDNPKIRGAAIEACALLPGSAATTTVARKALAVDNAVKVALIDVLGRRRETMTEEAAKIVVGCLNADDQRVRIAAIEAIGAASIESGLGEVITMLDAPGGAARDTAVRMLAHIPGQFATKQIVYTLRGNPGPKQPTLVRILGWRGHHEGLEQILAAAESTHPEVRLAGLAAIGDLPAAEGFDRLMAALHTTDAEQFEVVLRAFDGLKGEEITEKLIDAYRKAEALPQRRALLDVIGRRTGEAVVGLLLSAANDPVEAIRRGAFTGLGRCDDPRAAEVLLDVARNAPTSQTIVAVDAYLALAHRTGIRGGDASGMYITALKLAATAPQRNTAIEGVGRTVPAETGDAIAALEPLLDDAEVQGKAATVLAGFVLKLPEDQKNRAVPLLRKIRERSSDEDLRQQVSRRLEELDAAN